MPNNTLLVQAGAGRPVNDTPLSEIGFAEFTSKLITDVFHALVHANMTQTKSYLELLQSVSKDLTVFINDTHDEIGGAQIVDLLTRVLPDTATGAPKVTKAATLAPEDAKTLGQTLRIETDTDARHGALVTKLSSAAAPVKLTDIADGGTSGPTVFDEVLRAAARRLAADKYTLLKEMVKMGLLRLVVEHGVVETRLCYSTYTSSYHQAESSNYERPGSSTQSKVAGGLLSMLLGVPVMNLSKNALKVSTARSTDRDISGSSVQVFGRVQIDFKTDYQPLNT